MLDGGAGSEGEGVMWVRGSDTQFDNNLVSGQSHSGSKPRTSEAKKPLQLDVSRLLDRKIQG